MGVSLSLRMRFVGIWFITSTYRSSYTDVNTYDGTALYHRKQLAIYSLLIFVVFFLCCVAYNTSWKGVHTAFFV